MVGYAYEYLQNWTREHLPTTYRRKRPLQDLGDRLLMTVSYSAEKLSEDDEFNGRAGSLSAKSSPSHFSNFVNLFLNLLSLVRAPTHPLPIHPFHHQPIR